MLYAPGSYAFQGLDYRASTSSWTWQGRPLPFVDFTHSQFATTVDLFGSFIFGYPLGLRATYEQAVDAAPNREAARIKVERYRARILLFAGAKDEMWQSATMGAELRRHRPKDTRLVVYPEAGHAFGLPAYVETFRLGGTLEANRAAKTDSDRVLTETLAGRHPRT